MTDYSKLKVTELKDLVKDRGIASTGLKLKQNYVDALIADDDANGGGGDVKEQDDGDEEKEDEAVVEKEEDGDELAIAKEEDKNEPAFEGEKVELPAKTEDEMAEEKSDLSEEPTNKRKRRSPTPSLSEESVNKRIRTEDEKIEPAVAVKLPEDVDTDAPAPVEDEAAPPPVNSAPEAADHDGSAAQEVDMEEPEPMASHEEQPEPIAQREEASEGDMVPSKHPVTAALYIRDLVRPLQPNAVREHLLSVAQASGVADATIREFHLDRMRSHAFALFDSTSAASAVRGALHDKKWPDEPMRRPLWVDYIPEDSVREWIDTEVNKGDQQTRWEVVYSSAGLDTDGPVTASLQEADGASGNARNISRQAPGAGEGMPNAPSGPRRQSSQHQPSRSPEEARRPPNKSNDTLDEMYPFTTTKPKIYYQPVNRELIERRLEEFEKEKSRDWDDRFADPSAYAEGELRRYTFEDGDRLVDGGADFGLFGRSSRGGGGGGGGRGGGRGRGRGGDRYRGSARR